MLSFSECLLCICVHSLFTPFPSVFSVFHKKNFFLLNLINRCVTSISEQFLKYEKLGWTVQGGGGRWIFIKQGTQEPSANYVPLGASYYVCELSLQNVLYRNQCSKKVLYRNQSIDLHRKSVDWVLYESNTGVSWVKAFIFCHTLNLYTSCD